LHDDEGMDDRAHLLPPLTVRKSTALPLAQSLAVTHPCSGSRKNGSDNARSAGRPPGTVRIGVMSVHVLPKSSVATSSCRHLEGFEMRQRRTIATPKDFETSWKASTLVVRPVRVAGAEGEGIDRDVGTEGGDEVDGDGEGVHEAPIRPRKTKPATRILDGTGELLSVRRL
jgi:hypothetical protein